MKKMQKVVKRVFPCWSGALISIFPLLSRISMDLRVLCLVGSFKSPVLYFKMFFFTNSCNFLFFKISHSNHMEEANQFDALEEEHFLLIYLFTVQRTILHWFD